MDHRIRAHRFGVCLTDKRTTHLLITISLLVLASSMNSVPALSAQETDSASRYIDLGLEATNWIASFQVTPLNDSWGIPYQSQRAWGLDPFFFENGTISAEVGGIRASERQKLAFLIGGHDAGLGASAALDAYLQTNDPRYLKIFNVYFDFFQRAQAPNGYWAEQADVSAGPDGQFGSTDDSAVLRAVFPSPEHGNPIAAALISYYRWSHDGRALQMLKNYGSWLVNTQIKSGNWSGAFPVTQHYFAIGWKPRMYETTESAWILSELYIITGNETYLNSAESAGRYMLSRQFTGTEWANTLVFGALPYESNGTKYTNAVSTNHAGFTLLAWAQLFRITGDRSYLIGARNYARWLLSFQVTPTFESWGNHTYANDSMAVGGYYYGYNPEKHAFNGDTALSLWSAAYAIRGLLLLTQITNEVAYLRSALLAADWLTHMRYPDSSLVPLQALAITKYTSSSWWGLYPQFYQPDMNEVEKAGIPEFVAQGRSNPRTILESNLTWFEQTYNVNFNLIDYQTASRGPQYMKMLWSWWPSLGFEPRYGGDIAFGAFAIGNYLRYNETLQSSQSMLNEIGESTRDQTLGVPTNITDSYNRAQQLVREAEDNFAEGWYSTAMSKLAEVSSLTQATIRGLGILVPILQTNRTNRTILESLIVALIVLAVANVYQYYRLRRLSRSLVSRRRHSQRRMLRSG